MAKFDDWPAMRTANFSFVPLPKSWQLVWNARVLDEELFSVATEVDDLPIRCYSVW